MNIEEYTLFLESELTKEIIIACVVSFIIILLIVLVRPFLAWFDRLDLLEWINRKQWGYVTYTILTILFIFHAYHAYDFISDIKKDIRDDSFISYIGEIEYTDISSDKYTYYYNLKDTPNINIHTRNDLPRKAIADLVYAKHSQYLLDFKIIQTIEEW